MRMLVLTFALAASGAIAQNYPTKPIRLLVPFAPGGSSSIVARSVAVEMEKGLGQPLIIEIYGAAVRVCTKWDRFPDGTEFVGVGIQPDIRVERTRADVARRADPVLERALQFIRSR